MRHISLVIRGKIIISSSYSLAAQKKIIKGAQHYFDKSEGCRGDSYPDAFTEEISATTAPDAVGLAAIDRDYDASAALRPLVSFC